MPTILLKKSDTPGSVPGTANLTNLAGGVEVAVNTADKRVYSMTSASAVIELGTNPSSLTCSDVSATVLRAGSATITNLLGTTLTISGNSFLATSSGNVGIGTASPASQLDVSKTGDAVLSLTSSGVQRYQLIARSSGNFEIYDQSAAASRVTMTQSGNLGLGVTPSLWGAGSQAMQNGGGSLFQYNNDRVFIGQNNYIDTSFADKFIGNGYATRYRQYQGTHAFFVSTASNSSGAGALATFTQAMTLDASGRLLVGLTSDAAGGGYFGAGQFKGSFPALVLQGTEASAKTWQIGENAGALAFYNTTDGERARITSGGDVGIGTSSPGARLDVRGAATNFAGLNVINSESSSGVQTTSSIRLGITNSIGVRNTRITAIENSVDSNSVNLAFFTNEVNGLDAEVERARITSGGYFKASDAGTYNNSTGTYHELRQTANDTCAYISATNASMAFNVIAAVATRGASSAFNFLSCAANSVDQFYVRGDGVVYAQNTTIQSISDARLKENVRDASEGLNVINALRSVRYDWKEGFGNNRKDQLGFIAQEVEAVFPDAVSEWKAKEGEEAYKTVGPAALIPVLVKAIQELSAKVSALEAK